MELSTEETIYYLKIRTLNGVDTPNESDLSWLIAKNWEGCKDVEIKILEDHRYI